MSIFRGWLTNIQAHFQQADNGVISELNFASKIPREIDNFISLSSARSPDLITLSAQAEEINGQLRQVLQQLRNDAQDLPQEKSGWAKLKGKQIEEQRKVLQSCRAKLDKIQDKPLTGEIKQLRENLQVLLEKIDKQWQPRRFVQVDQASPLDTFVKHFADHDGLQGAATFPPIVSVQGGSSRSFIPRHSYKSNSDNGGNPRDKVITPAAPDLLEQIEAIPQLQQRAQCSSPPPVVTVEKNGAFNPLIPHSWLQKEMGYKSKEELERLKKSAWSQIKSNLGVYSPLVPYRRELNNFSLAIQEGCKEYLSDGSMAIYIKNLADQNFPLTYAGILSKGVIRGGAGKGHIFINEAGEKWFLKKCLGPYAYISSCKKQVISDMSTILEEIFCKLITADKPLPENLKIMIIGDKVYLFSPLKEMDLRILTSKLHEGGESLQEKSLFSEQRSNLAWLTLAKVLPSLERLNAWSRAHGDIKTANILIDHQGQVSLEDFNGARFLGKPEGVSPMPTNLPKYGTPAYAPPETLPCEAPKSLKDLPRYEKESDLWSLGVSIIDILSNNGFSALIYEVEVGATDIDNQKLRANIQDFCQFRNDYMQDLKLQPKDEEAAYQKTVWWQQIFKPLLATDPELVNLVLGHLLVPEPEGRPSATRMLQLLRDQESILSREKAALYLQPERLAKSLKDWLVVHLPPGGQFSETLKQLADNLEVANKMASVTLKKACPASVDEGDC